MADERSKIYNFYGNKAQVKLYSIIYLFENNQNNITCKAVVSLSLIK